MANSDTLYLACDSEALRFNPYPDDVKQKLLDKHFIYSVLLSNTVTIPVGCYFESRLVQNLVEKYKGIFLPQHDDYPIAGLGLGNDRESFLDDVKIKESWFPEKYGYRDRIKTEELFKRIRDIPPTIRYGKMRTKLTESILSDIGPNGASFQLLNKQADVSISISEVFKPLEKVVTFQEYALLPPYIEIEMERHGASGNRQQKQWLDFILFKNYALSCESTYAAYCNNPLVIKYSPAFRQIYSFRVDFRDTLLFEQFISIFPFRGAEKIPLMDSSEVLALKMSEYFQHYLRCYKIIVARITDSLMLYIPKLEYDAVQDQFRLYERNERATLKNHIVTNVNEAIVLYKTLRKPSLLRYSKQIAFNRWMKTRSEEFPLISILAEIDDKESGFLPQYIDELYYQAQQSYQQSKKQGRVPLMSNSIINVLFPGAIGNKVKNKIVISSDGDASKESDEKKVQHATRAMDHTKCKESNEDNGGNPSMRFAVALSFPSEFRSIVAPVADLLRNDLGEGRVFYDAFFEAECARRNLDVYLQNLYKNESELVVVFFGNQYYEKTWCETEGRAIRAMQSDKEAASRVMYIRCGEGEIDGFFGTIDGSLDAYRKNRTPQDLASAIITRLDLERKERSMD